MARNLFTEAAVDYSILDGDDQPVAVGQLVQQRGIDARDEAGIDECSPDALCCEQTADAAAQFKEVAQCEQGYFAAPFHQFILAGAGKVGGYGAVGPNDRSYGYPNGDRVFCLVQAPFEYGKVFLDVGRRQIH